MNRDIKAFPKLKDAQNWDTWYTEIKAQSPIQGIDEIVDSSYIPLSVTDELLFDENQKYMYVVFTVVLLTDKGTPQ